MRLFDGHGIRNVLIGLAAVGAALAWAPALHAADKPAAPAADSDEDDDLPPLLPTSLVPPPRTVDDIAALLEQQKPDPTIRQAAEAKVKAEPDASLHGDALAEFYLARGIAARSVGRYDQEVADYGKAIEAASGGIASDVGSRAAYRLGFAKIRLGRYLDGIAEIRKAIANVPADRRGRHITFSGQFARALAFSGDLDGAQAALDAAEPSSGIRGNGRGTRGRGRGNRMPPQSRAALFEGRGAIAAARGDYVQAETWFRRAVALSLTIDDAGAEFTAALQRRFLAQSLRMQGRLLESEVEFREALSDTLKLRGHYSYDTAACLLSLGSLLSDEGRAKDAERMAEAALDIFRSGMANDEGVDPVAKTQLLLASSLMAQHQAGKALAIFDALAGKLDRYSPQFRRFFTTYVNYPQALIDAGQPAKAVPLLEAALAQLQSRYRDDSAEMADQRGMLALALAASGQDGKALKLYRQVAPVLMQAHQSADPDSTTGRDRRAMRALGGYVDLLSRLSGGALERQSGIDAMREAFVAAEVVRSRSVQRAIADASARAAIS
ncbi:MAG TPA: tetratricopeptide repeat protein, partial [Candidatus Sulfotelmatobacter sp.]|nr:tetratricopeptide repeat protein [Candidatus Sulfotelmatobacter sp.]